MDSFRRFYPLFENASVIEIGSNCGALAYEIYPLVKSYVGVDRGEQFYSQAMLLHREHIRQAHVKFVNSTVQELLENELESFDILVVNHVIYMFNDEEVRLFRERLLRSCQRVLIQNLKRSRKPYNQYQLWVPANMKNMLEDEGFQVDIVEKKIGNFNVYEIDGVRA